MVETHLKKKTVQKSHQTNQTLKRLPQTALGAAVHGTEKTPPFLGWLATGRTLRQVLDKMLSLVKVRLKKMTWKGSGFRVSSGASSTGEIR